MADIELAGITKRYPDGTEAVSDLDLHIGDGELMILVGPSGCGKSTALRMIAGLEDVSDGEVRIGDRVVNDLEPKDRDIAMVFQNYALYPHMDVRANLGFALKLAKVPKADIARRVDEAAKVLGLEPYLHRKPANLSGGQRQRVAMGRAIVRQPQAFLMDEPLSNLDAKLRVQMRAVVARLQARLETTTVYVTHDQTEAMTLGDRVAVLRGGALMQVGTPMELYDTPANLFVAGFIGSPAMNFVPAAVDGDVIRLPFADVPLPDALRSQLAGTAELVAGIRPEHFLDATTAGEPIDGRERVSLTARIELVEDTGADRLLHLALDSSGVQADQLADLHADSGATDLPGEEYSGDRLLARISPEGTATRGSEARLLLDVDRIHWFDAGSGSVVA